MVSKALHLVNYKKRTMPSSACASAKLASNLRKHFVREVSDHIVVLSGVAKMFRKITESDTAVIASWSAQNL